MSAVSSSPRLQFSACSISLPTSSPFWCCEKRQTYHMGYIELWWKSFSDLRQFFLWFLLFCEEMLVLTYEDSAIFRLYTKVEKRWSLLVSNVPRVISPEDANFINFLASILPSGLQFLISDFAVPFRFCVCCSTDFSYTGSGGYTILKDCPFRIASTWIPSFAKRTSFHCWLHFSHDRGEWLFPCLKKHLYEKAFSGVCC